MKKLSKNDSLVKADHVSKLNEAWQTVESAKGEVDEVITRLNSSIEDYNTALSEAQSWRDDIVSQMDEYISDKSERWQEGENGQAYEAWKDEWEGLDLEPIDQVDMIDLPEADHATEIDGLSDEPSE